MLRLSPEVLDILSRAETEGSALRLGDQLDRKLYQATDKALVMAGGKWDRRAQAHMFPAEAAEILDAILLTGQVQNLRQEFGAFYTPPALALQLATAAGVSPGTTVLEPSAGGGAIADAARDLYGEVTCVEIRGEPCAQLRERFHTVHGDFLTMSPATLQRGLFDRVVMNPPFARQADAIHVLHAVRFLRPGGRLAAIMAASVTFRETRPYAEVRRLVVATGGAITPLPDGAFKSAGTTVRTVIATINAPQPECSDLDLVNAFLPPGWTADLSYSSNRPPIQLSKDHATWGHFDQVATAAAVARSQQGGQ